jgi:hypothetical protein
MKNNIPIFGFEERKDVGYLNTSGHVIKFLRESMELNILNRSTDYMTRLEKKQAWQILMKFTSFLVYYGC